MRLLASAADEARRRARHPSADPARRQEPQGHPPRLGRRPLRVHAPGPRHRARWRALRPTPSNHRARLRQHEVQPRHRSLQTPRTSRRPGRMATDHGITIPEIAEKMGIKQNYLYRVLPGLADDGLVVKDGGGWKAKDAA